MEHIYAENPFDKKRFEAINILGDGYDFGDIGDVGVQINSWLIVEIILINYGYSGLTGHPFP